MANQRRGLTNFYVTTVALDHTLTPWVDGILPLVLAPNITDGKLFFVVFNVTDPVNRFVLPVYMDAGQVKYYGYNISVLKDLHKYDECAINDTAELFNVLFSITDDFGKIITKTGLDIDVYGGSVVIWNELYQVSDTSLTLLDNSINYVVLDYSDQTLKVVSVLPAAYYQIAEITTAGGLITSNLWRRSFNVNDYFSSDFFEKNVEWAIIIKDEWITEQQIDFSTFTADDIFNGATHQFISPGELQQIVDNTTARHSHANKVLLDTYDQSNANIADAIVQKHSHTNKSILDLIPGIDGVQNTFVLTKIGATLFWAAQQWGEWGGTGILYISPTVNVTIWSVVTFVHNLWITQADVESGRYSVKFVYTFAGNWVAANWYSWLSSDIEMLSYIRSASDPTPSAEMTFQANELKVKSDSRGSDLTMVRCIIIDNGAWAPGWNPWTIPNYAVTFVISDSSIPGSFILDADVTLDGVTNLSGNYVFYKPDGTYNYSISKVWYDTLIWSVVVFWGIVTKTVALDPVTWSIYYNVDFTVKESGTLDPISNAIIIFDWVSAPAGNYSFSKSDWSYDYLVTHIGYITWTWTVVVSGWAVVEDVVLVETPGTQYIVDFDVLDEGWNALSLATVTLDWVTGIPWDYSFAKLPWTYNYSVDRIWYSTATGTVTVVNINITETVNMVPAVIWEHTVKFVIVDSVSGLSVTGATVTLDWITNAVDDYFFMKTNASYAHSISAPWYTTQAWTTVVSWYTTKNINLVFIPLIHMITKFI